MERGSSGSSVPGYSPRGTGFEPHARRPLLGSPSLNGYRSMTGNLNTAKKGTGHPTSLCGLPSKMGVAMCPSATLTSNMSPRFRFFKFIDKILGLYPRKIQKYLYSITNILGLYYSIIIKFIVHWDGTG